MNAANLGHQVSIRADMRPISPSDRATEPDSFRPSFVSDLISTATAFFERFPPADEGSFELEPKHRGDVPGDVHALWAQHGLPICGGGLVQFVDPAPFREVMLRWLMGGNGRIITPLAITAFAEVIYVRKLGESDMIPDPDSPFDIRILSPHYRSAGFLGWNLAEMLGRLDPAAPPNDSMFEFHPDFRRELFTQAVAAHGPLARGESFHFAPALALGGAEKIENVAKGDAATHLELLFSMI